MSFVAVYFVLTNGSESFPVGINDFSDSIITLAVCFYWELNRSWAVLSDRIFNAVDFLFLFALVKLLHYESLLGMRLARECHVCCVACVHSRSICEDRFSGGMKHNRVVDTVPAFACVPLAGVQEPHPQPWILSCCTCSGLKHQHSDMNLLFQSTWQHPCLCLY